MITSVARTVSANNSRAGHFRRAPCYFCVVDLYSIVNRFYGQRGGVVVQRVGRWTCYQKVAGSTSGRGGAAWPLLTSRLHTYAALTVAR